MTTRDPDKTWDGGTHGDPIEAARQGVADAQLTESVYHRTDAVGRDLRRGGRRGDVGAALENAFDLIAEKAPTQQLTISRGPAGRLIHPALMERAGVTAEETVYLFQSSVRDHHTSIVGYAKDLGEAVEAFHRSARDHIAGRAAELEQQAAALTEQARVLRSAGSKPQTG